MTKTCKRCKAEILEGYCHCKPWETKDLDLYMIQKQKCMYCGETDFVGEITILPTMMRDDDNLISVDVDGRPCVSFVKCEMCMANDSHIVWERGNPL